MPNKLSHFWQELKRRRVHRLMTIYAGSAYIIFEASTLIFPRWGLPDWTIDLVLYLLILGAIITFIVGWIYDLTPGGIQKTGPVSEDLTRKAPSTPNGWKIASYISLVVIVILLVLNIIPRAGKNEILDKSVAVLPFINDSPVSENDHYIQGYCTAVHSNLCKIKDLRVRNLLSSEQYRNQSKSIPEIAKELDVGYVLSARGQIINNSIRLTVYLTNASDDVVWSNPYDRQIEVVDDHINIQSEIAKLVAAALKVAITPDEQQLIEKIPTSSLSAHNHYLKGRDMLRRYESGEEDIYFLNEAERLFNLALERDPTYSMAYLGVGDVYYLNLLGYLTSWKYDSAQLISDTVIELTDLALKYDPQNSEAFNLRGKYYYEIENNHTKALEEYEKALEYNPNDHIAQHRIGLLSNDLLNALKSTNENLKRDNSEFIDESLDKLSETYSIAGFPEKAKYYASELLSINHDSARYYHRLSWIAYRSWNIDESYRYAEKAMQIDSTSYGIYFFLILHYTGNYKRIYADFLKPYENDFYNGDLKDYTYFNYTFPIHLGMYYWDQGDTAKAKSLLQFVIEIMHSDLTKFDIWGVGHSFRDALDHWIEICSVTGDIDYAFQLFKQFLDISSNYDVYQRYYISFMMSPRFANIRQESWFQDAIHEWESELAAEHERVRQWLEENDML